jgi:hypothetical protein
MVWKFAKNKMPENIEWATELTDDVMDKVCRGKCKTTYQVDYTGSQQLQGTETRKSSHFHSQRNSRRTTERVSLLISRLLYYLKRSSRPTWGIASLRQTSDVDRRSDVLPLQVSLDGKGSLVSENAPENMLDP